MLQRGKTYEEVYDSFRWDIPEYYNIGVAHCDRHADSGKLALIQVLEDGLTEEYTFQDIKRMSNRCANALAALGIQRGDRVAVFLSQGPELTVAHMAIFKLGAIGLPLFALFGPEGSNTGWPTARPRPSSPTRRASPSSIRCATGCRT